MKTRTKVVASILVSILLTTQGVFAHAAESAFWRDRQKTIELAALPAPLMANPAQILSQIPSPNLEPLSSAVSQGFKNQIPSAMEATLTPLAAALSSQYGSIRRISLPSNAHVAPGQLCRVVVHVQDIHMNAEAQANIGGMIGRLMDQKKIGLIGLEGAFGAVDLSVARAFENKEAVGLVADYLLTENRISGAVHAAFTSTGEIPAVVGVDDRAHYQANVQAFRNSLPFKEKDEKELALDQAALDRQASSVLNPALAAFQEKLSAYRNGRVRLSDHVTFLSQQLPAVSSNVEVFLEAAKMESTFDFKEVGAQRAALLARLVTKLSKAETTDFLNISVAYRLGSVTHASFYQYIKTLCSKKNVSLAQFKALDSYIRYALLTDSINAEHLFSEIIQMEHQAAERLIKTDDEKIWMAQAHRLYLTGKLLDFALTPEEWQEYKETVRSPESVVRSEAINNSVSTTHYGLLTTDYESFYEEAEARNRAITQNLLAAMDKNHAAVAVLVTGGFHTAGIDRLLQDAGVTAITFAPKVTEVAGANGSAYLSVFAQEKTPLDQLFSGEKLFVANNPAQASAAAVTPLLAATSLQLGDSDARVNQMVRRAAGSAMAEALHLKKIGERSIKAGHLIVSFSGKTITAVRLAALDACAVYLRSLWRRVVGSVTAVTSASLAGFLGESLRFVASPVLGLGQIVRGAAKNFTKGRFASIAAAFLLFTGSVTSGFSPVFIAQLEAPLDRRPIAVETTPAIALSEKYGGKDWYGRYRFISGEKMEAMLHQAYLQIHVLTAGNEELTGFHVEINQDERPVFRLFAKKVKGRWAAPERSELATGNLGYMRDPSSFVVETGINQLSFFIPAESLTANFPADMSGITYAVHVQTGEQQAGTKMNKRNVPAEAFVQGGPLPSGMRAPHYDSVPAVTAENNVLIKVTIGGLVALLTSAFFGLRYFFKGKSALIVFVLMNFLSVGAAMAGETTAAHGLVFENFALLVAAVAAVFVLPSMTTIRRKQQTPSVPHPEPMRQVATAIVDAMQANDLSAAPDVARFLPAVDGLIGDGKFTARGLSLREKNQLLDYIDREFTARGVKIQAAHAPFFINGLAALFSRGQSTGGIKDQLTFSVADLTADNLRDDPAVKTMQALLSHPLLHGKKFIFEAQSDHMAELSNYFAVDIKANRVRFIPRLAGTSSAAEFVARLAQTPEGRETLQSSNLISAEPANVLANVDPALRTLVDDLIMVNLTSLLSGTLEMVAVSDILKIAAVAARHA